MAYEIIQPPFTLRFREMPKKELKEYFEWFRSGAPHRIDELAGAVRLSPAFAGWKADFSPESLVSLGEWFASEVETRRRSSDELEDIASRSTYPIEIPDEELTDRTFSLAMDIGMYLCQVFMKHHASLRWDQEFGNKKFIDYGQPVLAGFGAAPFNPVRMIVTLAYGIASKKKGPMGLRELYDVWLKMVRT